MPNQQTAQDVLDREYLDIRCRLLDIAAALDRIGRGRDSSSVASDARLDRIRGGLEALQRDQSDRARSIQMIFSDPYEGGWR